MASTAVIRGAFATAIVGFGLIGCEMPREQMRIVSTPESEGSNWAESYFEQLSRDSD